MGTLQKQDVPDCLRGENQWETNENMLLYKAASEGNYLQLQKALALGANPNFISKSELGTLHVAARSASSSLVSDLIDKGARVSLRSISDRNEAIHEAANAGAVDTVRVLIEASPKSIMS